MNTKFTAAAQAIADHFKQAEALRGEPFRDTFTNPMCNDAVTPNFVGVPLALLRALVDAVAQPGSLDVTAHIPDQAILAINGMDRFFSTSESRYGKDDNPATQYHTGEPGLLAFSRELLRHFGRPVPLGPLVAAAGPIASDASHPMQPILLDDNGTPRFMRNAIVEHLAQDKLNELAKMGFCSEDRMQLAQLIGYSVSGYGELSYVCSESANEADKIAAALMAGKGGAA
jgi:hypothetical protein